MRIAHSGRAKISLRRPQAMGECDRCGEWHSLSAMRRQQQWAGNSLIDTGLLVGLDCLDVPQQQFRAPILPADPIPRVNPRPSPNVTGIPIIGQPLPTTPANQGFTQYTLGAAFPGLYPTTKSAVLSAVAQNSGVATPATLIDRSLIIDPTNTPMVLMPAATTRSFLLLYNPSMIQIQFSLTTATWGSINNLEIGPGQAYFWATAQLLGATTTSAVSVDTIFGTHLPALLVDGSGRFITSDGITPIQLLPGFPIWAWEAP